MYTFHSKVRYSEVDQNGRLSLSSVVNYFQDCSTFQSEELGIGVDALKKSHHAWLLNSWQVVLASEPADSKEPAGSKELSSSKEPVGSKELSSSLLPKLCDEITVGTWAYDFKGFYGYRNFLMQNKAGEALAYANSIWVYIDTATGHPSRCPDEEGRKYPLEPPYPMEHAPRKIALPDHFTELKAFPVPYSSIDTNHHVNNCAYVKMAVDCLPADFTYHQMRAEYRNAAVLGDTIVPSLSLHENVCVVKLSDTAGKPYAILEFA